MREDPLNAQRRFGSHAALAVVCIAVAAMLASVNLAAPLYASYQAQFGFSSLTLTLVFATYALRAMRRSRTEDRARSTTP
jgi:hypothetical protein